MAGNDVWNQNHMRYTTPSMLECYGGTLLGEETHSSVTLSNSGLGHHVTRVHHSGHMSRTHHSSSSSRQNQSSPLVCGRYITLFHNTISPYLMFPRKMSFCVLVVTTVVFVLLSVLLIGGQVGHGLHFRQLSWRGFSDMEQRLPQAIIVGIRKCGTRALIEFLSIHPDISHAHDEMHFFDRGDRYALGLEWYRKQMPPSHPHQITIEKTPGYFIAPHAPSLIHNMNNSIRLLIIVRNPVTRIISDYTQSYFNHVNRNMTYTPFEDLIIDPKTGDIRTLYKPIWISMYYLHYMHWLDVFNHSQIHLVDGDNLVENPTPELNKIETFLGLKHHIRMEHFYLNKTRGFYCIKKDNESRCLNPSKGRPHPNIKPRVLHKLYEFFKPLNEKFYKLSGEFFDWSEAKRRKRKP